MPRPTAKAQTAWRDFEQLVARIEHALAGTNISVKSPDRVRSRLTGRRREVDAALRGRIGSADLLVTIECRKRRATQDVTWIEQLGSKKQAIGAARTIAVASSAFSQDAVQAATFYGIDLRVLSEITDVDIESWILPQFVVHVYKCCDLIEGPEVILYPEPGDPQESISSQLSGDPFDSAVFVGTTGEDLSFNDLWLRIDEQMRVFDSIPRDDKSYVRRLVARPDDDLRLRTRGGLRRVHEVRMALALRWKHERLDLRDANVVAYRPARTNDPMRTVIRAEFLSKEAPSMNVRFGMQFEPGSTDATFTIETLPIKK